MTNPINLVDVCKDLIQMQQQLMKLNGTNPNLAAKPEVAAKIDELDKRLATLQQQLVSLDRYFKDTVTINDNLGGGVNDRRESRAGSIIAKSTGRKQ